MKDIIIAGAGPAGLTAAIYAARAGAEVLVLEREAIGGRILNSPMVDNYPGTPHINGYDYVMNVLEQANEMGAEVDSAEITDISPVDGGFKVVTDMGEYTAKSIILATGMKDRKLGIASEDDIMGISYCAVCDGAFYRDKQVAVVGGGNTALTEALFLSDMCSRVSLIHRRDSFRGEGTLIERVKSKEKIEIIYDTVIEDMISKDGRLKSLVLKDVKSDSCKELEVDGLFVAVGQLPGSDLLSGRTDMDNEGFYAAGEDCLSKIPGVFVAGDCRAKRVRQLTTAVSDGAVAGLSAAEYVKSL